MEGGDVVSPLRLPGGKRPSAEEARRAVRAAYDRWAARYEADRNATRDLAAQVLRSQALPLAGARILELGCGTGLNTAWLRAQGARVVAVDLSSGMLRRARRRAGGVDLLQVDLGSPWPLASGWADGVVETLVLEHLPDLEPIFAEAFRVLRPGGTFFLCELHPERQRRGVRARFRDPETGRWVGIPAFLHPLADYLEAARRAGFRVDGIGAWWTPEDARRGRPARILSLRLERPS